MLRFVIGNISDFEQNGINIVSERKSNNGKAIKHLEHLTDEQFANIRFNDNFEFKSDEALTELLDNIEWS